MKIYEKREEGSLLWRVKSGLNYSVCRSLLLDIAIDAIGNVVFEDFQPYHPGRTRAATTSAIRLQNSLSFKTIVEMHFKAQTNDSLPSTFAITGNFCAFVKIRSISKLIAKRTNHSSKVLPTTHPSSCHHICIPEVDSHPPYSRQHSSSVFSLWGYHTSCHARHPE